MTAFISITLTYSCARASLYIKGLGKGFKLESKINQCRGLYCMSTAVVSLASPLAVISKLQRPHVNSLIHTQRADAKQTDASVCHPSLNAWTTPRRSELAKCCPGTKIDIFQLLCDLMLCV